METIDDPVLGKCTLLPCRWGASAVLIPLLFVAMGIGGPIILLIWLLDPGTNFGPTWIIEGVIGTLLTPLVPGMIKRLTASIPWFAVISPVGFAALGDEPILWKDVDDIGVVHYRGKPVRLYMILTRPRKRGPFTRIRAVLGRVGLATPPNRVSLPLAGAPIPFEQLLGMFIDPWLASQPDTNSELALAHWPAYTRPTSQKGSGPDRHPR